MVLPTGASHRLLPARAAHGHPHGRRGALPREHGTWQANHALRRAHGGGGGGAACRRHAPEHGCSPERCRLVAQRHPRSRRCGGSQPVLRRMASARLHAEARGAAAGALPALPRAVWPASRGDAWPAARARPRLRLRPLDHATRAVRPDSTPYAHHVHTTCTPRAHHAHTPYTRHAHHVHTPCTLHAHVPHAMPAGAAA